MAPELGTNPCGLCWGIPQGRSTSLELPALPGQAHGRGLDPEGSLEIRLMPGEEAGRGFPPSGEEVGRGFPPSGKKVGRCFPCSGGEAGRCFDARWEKSFYLRHILPWEKPGSLTQPQFVFRAGLFWPSNAGILFLQELCSHLHPG